MSGMSLKIYTFWYLPWKQDFFCVELMVSSYSRYFFPPRVSLREDQTLMGFKLLLQNCVIGCNVVFLPLSYKKMLPQNIPLLLTETSEWAWTSRKNSHREITTSNELYKSLANGNYNILFSLFICSLEEKKWITERVSRMDTFRDSISLPKN